MPHDLPKAYEPGAIEPRWAEYWVHEKLFHVETPAGDAQAAGVHADPAAAQRHRTSAHGPHAEPDGDGHHRPLAAHARLHHAVASRHRPRRHRHADDGGAPTGRRRQEPPRHRPRSLHRARVGLEAALRRRHPRPDEAARRLGGLVARVLHHGRAHVARRARGLRPPVRRRADLSRQVHRQLVPALHHRGLRSRSRARRDAGQALRDSLSGQLDRRTNTSWSRPRVPRPCWATPRLR